MLLTSDTRQEHIEKLNHSNSSVWLMKSIDGRRQTYGRYSIRLANTRNTRLKQQCSKGQEEIINATGKNRIWFIGKRGENPSLTWPWYWLGKCCSSAKLSLSNNQTEVVLNGLRLFHSSQNISVGEQKAVNDLYQILNQICDEDVKTTTAFICQTQQMRNFHVLICCSFHSAGFWFHIVHRPFKKMRGGGALSNTTQI